MPKTPKPPDKVEQPVSQTETSATVAVIKGSKQKGKRGSRVDPIDYMCIKMPASGILRLKHFVFIQDVVCKMNIITMRAYELLRLYVVVRFQKIKNSPDEQITLILDLPMFKYALSLVANTAKPPQTPKSTTDKDVFDRKTELAELYTTQFKPFLVGTGSDFKNGDCTNFPYIFEKTAEEMKTAYENNVQMRFIQNLILFLKTKLSEDIVKKGTNNERILKFTKDNGLPEPNDGLMRSLHYQIRFNGSKYVPLEYKPIINDILVDKAVKAGNDKLAKKVFKALRVMDDKKVPDNNDVLANLYNECVEVYLPYDLSAERPLEYDVKVDEHTGGYFTSMLRMTDYFESVGQQLGQMCPLRSSEIPSHIMIQQKYIEAVFKGESKPIMVDETLSDEARTEKLFNIVLNMDRPLFAKMKRRFKKVKAESNRSGWVFYNTFNTDGVSCSLTFARYKMKDGVRVNPGCKPKVIKEEILITNQDVYTELRRQEISNKVILGVDPGKSNLIAAIDSDDNMLIYTNNQRRHETLSYGHSRDRDYLSKKPYYEGLSIKQIEVDLSKQRPKTMNPEKFLEYVKTKIRVGDIVRPFYQQKLFRNMSLRRHIRERTSIAALVRKIKDKYGHDGKKIVLGYGNWSRDTQMKGCAPSLGSGLKKKLGKHFEICMVGEYNTSKMCNRCGKANFKKMKVPHKDLGMRELHRVLICKECVSRKDSHCTLKNRFVNRDRNAARNILEVFKAALEGKPRPEHLKQPQNEEDEDDSEDESEDDSEKENLTQLPSSEVEGACLNAGVELIITS